MTGFYAADRVRAGTVWLDENYGGWRDRVSINDLELADTCKCVLGQLFETEARVAGIERDGVGIGFWWLVENEGGAEPYSAIRVPALPSQILTSQEAAALGFDIDDDDSDDYNELTHLWRQVLKGVAPEDLEPLEDLYVD